MAKLFNLTRFYSTTTGSSNITVGTAVAGYLLPASAGVVNNDIVAYAINDGASSEDGTATYNSSGTNYLSNRTPTNSTNGGSAINLSGSAQVFLTPRKEDIFNTADPLGSAQVAVQADQETATSTTLAVTPGRQQFHPSAAKAWVRMNGTGTIAINDSYNVSSITDNGVGDYTLNLTTAFSSANYAASGITGTESGSCFITPISFTTTAFRFSLIDRNISFGARDQSLISVMLMGDQ